MEDDDLLPIVDGTGKDELKKLYSWTREEAMKAQEKWWQEDHTSKERGPLFKWIAAKTLKGLYEQYKSGKKKVILDVFYICSLHDLAIPKWCSDGLVEAVRKVHHYSAASWDDAFGRPYPKGTHLAAKRQKWEKAPEVYYRIQEIRKHDPSIPIDGYLFETVGKELGIGGKTLTEEYYYLMKNSIYNIHKEK